jgi:hypothetical protein
MVNHLSTGKRQAKGAAEEAKARLAADKRGLKMNWLICVHRR